MIQDCLPLAKEVFPICIPSYNRWDKKENKTLSNLIANCDEEIQRNTYVFVRAEQEEAYRESFGGICNIVVLPKVNGLSSTRQYICDYVADTLNKPYCIDMDDDIVSLGVVELSDGKIKSVKEDTAQIFRLGCEIAKRAFEKDKTMVLGAMRRIRFCNNEENVKYAFVSNKGPTPRQVTFCAVQRMAKVKIRRNPTFDVNGDDIGLVAECSKAYGSFFSICCLTYNFVDDSVNSVIRNKSNIRQKTAHTYNELKKYPLINYLRIPFTFEDGAYKFGDIDFTKYKKYTGKKSLKYPMEELWKSLK